MESQITIDGNYTYIPPTSTREDNIFSQVKLHPLPYILVVISVKSPLTAYSTFLKYL